jgi:hypothetical protein
MEHDDDIKADVEKAKAQVANGHKPATVRIAPEEGTVDAAEYLKHFGIHIPQGQ